MSVAKRVLIVGSDKIFAIENFYFKYFRALGIDTRLFSGQSTFFDYYQASLLNKLTFRAGLSNILSKINNQFRKEVAAFNPSVIWVFKGMEISPASLQWARDRKIKLVNYNPDNPFLFTGKGSGNKYITDAVPLYDMHFTYNLAIKKRLEQEFHLPVSLLPFGFDVDDKVYEACTLLEEKIKTCFLGNPDKDRAAFINALAESGVEIDLYGNDWSKFSGHKNITIFPPVYGELFWKTLRQYRVQLNLMRVHNLDSHNMRSFEVPGIGGIMLAPDTTEHRQFFEVDRNTFLFNELADCKATIDHLLSLSPFQADMIRADARQYSISSGYTYKDRAAFAWREIEKLHD